jgi:hypothetical protein
MKYVLQVGLAENPSGAEGEQRGSNPASPGWSVNVDQSPSVWLSGAPIGFAYLYPFPAPWELKEPEKVIKWRRESQSP